MILDKLARPTPSLGFGDKVRDCFEMCAEYGVPGLPFVDDSGLVVGRLSMRHIFRERCIPRYILDSAHLLGDDIHEVNIPSQSAFELLELPVDAFVLKQYAYATPQSPIIKGLAIMEKLSTNYIFIMEGEQYHGIVTRRDIARRMVEASRDFSL
jgi:CBS domain-containing protein